MIKCFFFSFFHFQFQFFISGFCYISGFYFRFFLNDFQEQSICGNIWFDYQPEAKYTYNKMPSPRENVFIKSK